MAFIRLTRACLIVATAFALSSPAAAAPSRCGPYKSLKKFLSTAFKERHEFVGRVPNPQWRAELWASKDGKTWTLIAVNDMTDWACLVISGKDWKRPGQGT